MNKKLNFSLHRAADAPQTTCGHIKCNSRCEQCWTLIEYLADKFGLDSWDDGPKFWTAWDAIKGKLRGVYLRNALIQRTDAEDRAEVSRWMAEWRAKETVQCFWCKGQFAPAKCHADHVLPVSKGGPHSLGNMVIACARCNQRKGDKMPAVWLAELEKD